MGMETKLSIQPDLEGLKIVSFGKEKGREKVPIIRINFLANELVRHLSKLYERGFREWAIHVLPIKQAFGKIIYFSRDTFTMGH